MGGHTYDQLAIALGALPALGLGEASLALLRAATPAPSSHNTQPWMFRVEQDRINIEPDFSRRCDVVDPDHSHLSISLGYAAENVVAAAPAYACNTDVTIQNEGRIILDLAFRRPANDVTARRAISKRQCTRLPYDGKPIQADEKTRLEAAGMGSGVRILMVERGPLRRIITDYVIEGDHVQLSDKAWRNELIHWVRFNDAAAIALGDGLSGRPPGQPAIPTWFGNKICSLLLRPSSQAIKESKNLRAASGIALFVGAKNDTRTWIETGRAYQRFALQAKELGLRNAFTNQPIKVPKLKQQLHSDIGLESGKTALLMVRYGRGPLAAYGLRRPLGEVQSTVLTSCRAA